MGRIRKRRRRQGRPAQEQAEGKWHLKGFSTSPGNTKLVAGRYTMKAVESQVWMQGVAGKGL